MHDDLFAPTSPPITSHTGASISGVARLLGLPEPGLSFSVPPRHRGGIEARSGLDFQDQDAIRQIGRLLRQDGQRALSVRLEGTGDTDVLALREGGGLVEEYRQVKGRREGQAKWTLNELGREGVWSEFIQTAAAFAERAGAERSLLLVFVTDGELDAHLQALRQGPGAFRSGSGDAVPGREVMRGGLLMHGALGLLSPAVAARLQAATRRDELPQLCEDLARVLDRAWSRQEPVRRVTTEWPTEAADAIAELASRLDGEDAGLFASALQEAARHLDFLLECLRFESRAGRAGAEVRGQGDAEAAPAGQAEVVLVLIEAGRLDTASAREAVRKLREAVADRSLVGDTLDEGAVRRGPRRPVGQSGRGASRWEPNRGRRRGAARRTGHRVPCLGGAGRNRGVHRARGAGALASSRESTGGRCRDFFSDAARLQDRWASGDPAPNRRWAPQFPGRRGARRNPRRPPRRRRGRPDARIGLEALPHGPRRGFSARSHPPCGGRHPRDHRSTGAGDRGP